MIERKYFGTLALIFFLLVLGSGALVAANGNNLEELALQGGDSLYLPMVKRGTMLATTRVSVASDGSQGSGVDAALSSDGRYVAFMSDASTLVPGDLNGKSDIFVHDRQTHETSLVSVASDGAQGNDDSRFPAISADGRYVAFHSFASTLIEGDTNGSVDVFVHDRQSGVTTRVSVASDGTQGDSVSDAADISANGRFVTFQSAANNLVSGDLNGMDDIFVHDRQTGETFLISVAIGGAQADDVSGDPSISTDGRFVAFQSDATNLVVDDSNGAADIFVHDRQVGQTVRVSVTMGGLQANGHSHQPAISGDGRHVAFVSFADNLVSSDANAAPDIFVRDRQNSVTTRASLSSAGSPSDGESFGPTISEEGRYVAFWSSATTLVDDGGAVPDAVYLRDLTDSQTTRLSSAPDGSIANGDSYNPALSADGRYVAYQSAASNLVSGDTNGAVDIFLLELP